MNLYRKLGNLTIGLGASAFLLMSGAGIASAQRVVSAAEPIIISNDITNQTTDVESVSGGNRSGLGDGSNPGQGDGRDNSTNEGVDNPNQAPGS